MNKKPWELRPEEEEDIELYRHFKLIDLEQLFASSPNAKCINTDSSVTKDLAKSMTDSVFSNCDGDLGFVPSCQCGAIRGVSKLGLKCPMCETVVSSSFVDSISHTTWISIPNDFPPLLHPTVYNILAKHAKANSRKKGSEDGVGRYAVIDAFLNPGLDDRKNKIELSDELRTLLAGKRGFDYFYEHTDEMLDIFFNKYSKNVKNKKSAEVKAFIDRYRDVMFTRKIPLLHNSLHPVTVGSSKTLIYIDVDSAEIMKALATLNNLIDKKRKGTLSQHALNKGLYKVYQFILNYGVKLLDAEAAGKLGGKPGMIRKHCLGSRLHFTYRAVVKPQSVAMPLDELVMPWGIMLVELKLPIINYLTNVFGYTTGDALDKWHNALGVYDHEVDQCIRKYIDESWNGRIPVVMGRNPTLAYGSEMLLYVRNYKKDVHDETIEVNACIVGPLNMDFDGMYMLWESCRH